MNLDFLWRLNNHINSLNLYAESYIGNLDVGNSISIMALPGGISTTYYDGTRDQDYNVQISAKAFQQQDCVEALNNVMSNLIMLDALPSQNNSYEFDRVLVDNPPTFVTQLETGEFIYELSATAKLTIFKGVY